MTNMLSPAITLKDALHGFRQGREMGKATLEENMDKKLEGLCHENIFQVFLDVRKSCELLDRGRCIEILRGYGIGTNLNRFLKILWYEHAVVPKAGRLYGQPFGTNRRLDQGNLVSQNIFNIMVEAVVRDTLMKV